MHSTLKRKPKTTRSSHYSNAAKPSSVTVDNGRTGNRQAYTGLDSKIYRNLFLLTFTLDVGSMVVYGVNIFELLTGCVLLGVSVGLSIRLHNRRG